MNRPIRDMDLTIGTSAGALSVAAGPPTAGAPVTSARLFVRSPRIFPRSRSKSFANLCLGHPIVQSLSLMRSIAYLARWPRHGCRILELTSRSRRSVRPRPKLESTLRGNSRQWAKVTSRLERHSLARLRLRISRLAVQVRKPGRRRHCRECARTRRARPCKQSFWRGAD